MSKRCVWVVEERIRKPTAKWRPRLAGKYESQARTLAIEFTGKERLYGNPEFRVTKYVPENPRATSPQSARLAKSGQRQQR